MRRTVANGARVTQFHRAPAHRSQRAAPWQSARRRQQPRIKHDGHWQAFKADLARFIAQDVDLVPLTHNGEDDSADATRDAVEALLAAGDRAAAIAQAKRMLVLKPDSRAAQEKLKALSEGK